MTKFMLKVLLCILGVICIYGLFWGLIIHSSNKHDKKIEKIKNITDILEYNDMKNGHRGFID